MVPTYSECRMYARAGNQVIPGGVRRQIVIATADWAMVGLCIKLSTQR